MGAKKLRFDASPCGFVMIVTDFDATPRCCFASLVFGTLRSEEDLVGSSCV
jgi:hypothetical protein